MIQLIKFILKTIRNLFSTQILSIMSGSRIEPNSTIQLGLSNYALESNVFIGQHCYIGPGISIGKFSRIGDRAIIHCSPQSRVSIGRFCSIAADVSIINTNHPADFLSTSYRVFKRKLPQFVTGPPITIGHDVWIGKGATILNGVKIGDGAIIGAGSVVTRDVEDYSIVAGNPAKKIKDRFSPTSRRKIKDMKWWNWPISRIYQNKDLFSKKIQ